MSEPLIIDAHAHVGLLGRLPCPEMPVAESVAAMDRLGIELAICSDQEALAEGARSGLDAVQRAHEESAGRIHGLGVFDSRCPDRCLGELSDALGWEGLRGIKIHPTMHGTPAEDPAYEAAWQFAAEHNLPILAHSWSPSDYNPAQGLSTPERFEVFVRRFPSVRLVLSHVGGRGTGRAEAVRMANLWANVYLDFAGDIFCYRLIEKLVASVPTEKILFGSDFPWTSPAAHLTRVLLSPICEADKEKILGHNAICVFKIGAEAEPCQ